MKINILHMCHNLLYGHSKTGSAFYTSGSRSGAFDSLGSKP
jgi:hypothetical protein